MDDLPLAVLGRLLVESDTDLARASTVDGTAGEAKLLRHANRDAVHLHNVVVAGTGGFAREIGA